MENDRTCLLCVCPDNALCSPYAGACVSNLPSPAQAIKCQCRRWEIRQAFDSVWSFPNAEVLLLTRGSRYVRIAVNVILY